MCLKGLISLYRRSECDVVLRTTVVNPFAYVEALNGEMGQHVIKNDISCINCLQCCMYVVLVFDGLTVQDFINDY